MATNERTKSGSQGPADLLGSLRHSGILPDAKIEEIRSRVLDGGLPIDSGELARILVKDQILTEYQARRLLSNRSGGLVIGRYVILEKLGAGSMGRVYKARHRMMDRTSAIKIIAPEISNNDRVVARFQREMRMVGKLDHVNVVRAFDADQDRGILYIAMEYVPGDSLGHRLRTKGPIAAAELVSFASQAARGLHHAHECGIVHRDVKPSNLLLGEGGTIKVLDLGLGVLLAADEQSSFATADGVAVGTIDYMSPEQACGRDVDPRSDLFSLGCTMYHLLTGRLPFPGNSPVERLGARIGGSPIPAKEVKPDLPSRLVEILDRLLANRPNERFQDAASAADALDSLLKKRTAPAVPAPAPTPTKPQDAPAPVRYVKVKPSYPAWFQPLATLAEARGTMALLLLIGILAAIFGIGLLLGRLL